MFLGPNLANFQSGFYRKVTFFKPAKMQKLAEHFWNGLMTKSENFCSLFRWKTEKLLFFDWYNTDSTNAVYESIDTHVGPLLLEKAFMGKSLISIFLHVHKQQKHLVYNKYETQSHSVLTVNKTFSQCLC